MIFTYESESELGQFDEKTGGKKSRGTISLKDIGGPLNASCQPIGNKGSRSTSAQQCLHIYSTCKPFRV